MKALMILGALVGFLIGSGPALAGLSSWSTALWRASAAALVMAVLTRWWTRICLQGLQESLSQRRHLKNVRLSQPNPPAKP
jgi:hypothetical protein